MQEPSTPLSWENLGLSEEALAIIKTQGFASPSPVQALSIPAALEGRDVIVSSQTGSGKTAAFALPMIEKFIGREGTFGLVLAPTREIVQQIQATFDQFGKSRGIRSICLIGGIDMRIDATNLATYPHVIVATPGRLCDHLDRGNVWLDFIQFVVLDEADRMLDMGFSDQLARVMEDVPKVRQTLLFSATIPPSVDRLAQKILNNPFPVTIGQKSSAVKTVEQRLVWTTEEGKKRDLMRLLEREKGSVIVFTRSKDGATRLWRSLHSAGIYDATYIHSDRLQSHREQALADFKSGTYRILIATDVAARGIHVDAVAHVINYDLPMEPEDYVHRIGRTGRMDAKGMATTLATPRDRAIMGRIEKLAGKPIDVIELRRSSGGSRPDRGDRAPSNSAGSAAGTEGAALLPPVTDGSRKVIVPRSTPLPLIPEGAEGPVAASSDDEAADTADFSDSAESDEGVESGEAGEFAAEDTEGAAGTEGPDGGPRKRRRRRGRRGRGRDREGAPEGQTTQLEGVGPNEGGEASAPAGELSADAPAAEPKPRRVITLPPRPARAPEPAFEEPAPTPGRRKVMKVVSSAIIIPPRDPNAPPPEPEAPYEEPVRELYPASGSLKPFPVD
jgi:ATP-dependent RNA helicase RhlE